MTVNQAVGLKTHQVVSAQNQGGAIAARVKEINRLSVVKDEEIMRSLLPDAAPNRRKYPESEFRKNFLPVISGEAYKNLPPNYTDERLHNEAHRFWMQVAGGPNLEVEVVDASGEVAFIVPAMMDTSVLNTAQPKNHPGLRKLNSDVSAKMQGLPEVATREMLVGLERKLVYMTSGSKVDETKAQEKVNKIREYYGLKNTPDESAPQAASSDNFMGMMSFD